MRRDFLLVLGLLFLLNFGFVLAEDGNLTDVEMASACLEESRVYVSELIEANFSSERVGDVFKLAETTFSDQDLLEAKGRDYNYLLVLKKMPLPIMILMGAIYGAHADRFRCPYITAYSMLE